MLSGRARSLLICVLALAVVTTAPATAQPTAVQQYSQDELDQLLAPIALYPDQLLAQILMAATYPLEVVEAARFVRQNPGLTGPALDQAVAEKNWDPSVQSLTAFPQVLAMMDDKLEWTQRLGDAFLVDQQRVMDTVQSLRQRAQAAGNLYSTPEQSVFNRDNEIVIEPVQPDVVYVPVYNPLDIYGPWWASAYPPWFWYPPPIYGYPVGVVVTTVIIFGRGHAVWRPHWGWARPHWRKHHIALDVGNNPFWNRPGHPRPPVGGSWQHAPEHRRGIAYPDWATTERFLRVDPNAVRARENFRHYELAPTGTAARPSAGAGHGARGAPQPAPRAPPAVQPRPGAPLPGVPRPGAPLPSVPRPGAPQTPRAFPQAITPPFDPGLSRQQAQINAQRGMQSRQAIGSVPARSGPAPSGAGAPHGGRQR